MKQKKLLLLVLLLTGALFSCKKESSKTTTSPCSVSISSFPTSVGSYWVYKSVSHFDLVHLNDTTTIDTIYLSVIKDTVYSGMTLAKIGCYSTLLSYPAFSLSGNNADGFITYFSDRSSVSLLRMRRTFSASIFEESNKISNIDTVPTTILKFPLNAGTTWIFRDNAAFKIQKEYTGNESVTVPAGTFCCNKIQWDYLRFPGADKPQMYEYFSGEGLIKKTLHETNIDFADPAGNPIDNGDLDVTIELLDYHIN